jgi:hypothetical protein
MVGSGALVFAVWGYVISNGHYETETIELNPKLLAFILGETEETIQHGIDFLASPDPKSRTKEHDGRRLIRQGEFLYFIPNLKKYRDTFDEEQRRTYMKEYMKEYRKQRKTNVNTCKQMLTQGEGEGYGEGKEAEEPVGSPVHELPRGAELALNGAKKRFKPAHPLKHELMKLWDVEYPMSHNGNCYHYTPKDDVAIETLLSKHSPVEIMEQARRGWNSKADFIYQKASTFPGINQFWNEIGNDSRSGKPKGSVLKRYLPESELPKL